MRYRFLQFENAEVTKRIGLPPGKPDFKPVTPQNTQIFDLKDQPKPDFSVFLTNHTVSYRIIHKNVNIRAKLLFLFFYLLLL